MDRLLRYGILQCIYKSRMKPRWIVSIHLNKIIKEFVGKGINFPVVQGNKLSSCGANDLLHTFFFYYSF